MKVTELESFHAKWTDMAFTYSALLRIWGRLEQRKSDSLALGLMAMLSGAGNAENTITTVKQEAKFLGKYREFNHFLRTANPHLSSFVPKPNSPGLDLGVRTSFAFLAEWNACSRRVFQLGKETQRLLEEATYDELEMDDLVVPFPNFVVRFAEPIVLHGERFGAVGFSESVFAAETSLIMPSWSLVFLPADPYVPIPRGLKDKVCKDLEKSKKVLGCAATVGQLFARAVQSGFPATFFAPITGTTIPQVVVPASAKGDEGIKLVRKVHTVIVNLMAIMGRLGRRGPSNVSFSTGGHADVLSTENVFDLSGMSSLGEAVEVGCEHVGEHMTDNSARHITPHWRRKHWRRHPGMGHLPDAPRDVKVPATLVLGDFLRPGTMPVGAITRI